MLTVHAGDDITTWQLISKIKAGEADSATTVQAFARHRQAGLVEAAGIAENASEDASDADNEYDGGAGACGYRMACRAIATAILAAAGRS